MTKEVQKKILVINDEPDTLVFLVNLLHSEEFYPIDAKSKIEGFEKAVAQKPAVIIIDMTMSGEGGIQMYRCLKSDETLKRIPVIMLSTIERETFFKFHNIQSFPSGCALPVPEAFLEKPFETDTFLKTVQKLSSPRVSSKHPARKRMEA